MSITRRKWWLVSIGIMVVIVGVVVVGAIALPAIWPRPREIRAVQSEQQTQSDNGQQDKQASNADVRELAGRLIAASYFNMNGEAQTVELMPGALPGDLPIKLTVPQGGRLVGSAVHQAGSKTTGWEVVMDAPGTVEEVSKFYEGEITKQGWKAESPGFHRPEGGFQMGSPAPGDGSKPVGPEWEGRASPVGLNFCQDGGNGSLRITISPRQNAPNDVQIDVDQQEFGPCGDMAQRSSASDLSNLLPKLYAPEGVQITSSGGGGGSSDWSSSATIEAEQQASALEAHFAGQLEKAGWVRVAGGAEGPLAWSTWKVPGEGDWQGFLYVLQGAAENRKHLFVQVESASAQFGGSMQYGESSVDFSTEVMEVQPAMPAVTAPAAPER